MITKTALETIETGKKYAEGLRGGEVIGLVGDLGSGKTTFVKGLAERLKVTETITSPTFVILKSYQGRIGSKKITFVHIDAYRIESLDDIKSVGIEDYLYRDDTIIAVEWAKKIKEILPQDSRYIHFVANNNERQIEIQK